MQQTTSLGRPPNESLSNNEAHVSVVSWAAVIAGAFVAEALSLTLLALGAGFGLLTVSPWSSAGASASAVDAVAIIWLIVLQIVASGVGGFLLVSFSKVTRHLLRLFAPTFVAESLPNNAND